MAVETRIVEGNAASISVPSRWSNLIFTSKVIGLRLIRTFKNVRNPLPKIERDLVSSLGELVTEVRSPLWTTSDPREQRLESGKVQNLRVAAKLIDGIVIPAGVPFSFWHVVGRASARRGFVLGRQLQEGCIVPAIGGGLCQLSNGLYQAALRSGCEIAERHPHTRVLPGSASERGEDATVAWNHIDLRFQSKRHFRIRVFLTENDLVIRFESEASAKHVITPVLSERPRKSISIGSCETCGDASCFRAITYLTERPLTQFVCMDLPPEFRSYLAINHEGIDGLVRDSDWFLKLQRSLALRQVASQGPARRAKLLVFDEQYAKAFSKRIRPEVRHLVVDIVLLPHLWRLGTLGGRTFDVLMTRWPISEIHRRLDASIMKFENREKLSDFRARESLLVDESAALCLAKKVITANVNMAEDLGQRSILVPWALPKSREITRGNRIIFPGPTTARKGCYELRSVMQELDQLLVVCGSDLEGENFWDGVKVGRPGEDWLEGVKVVVAPSIFEDRPQKLLEAVACGIPVITTPGSGLQGYFGVSIIDFGDPAALKVAIQDVLSS